MKTIGLIGGMSWQSTQRYYQALNSRVAAQLGGLHSAQILLHSLNFAPIAEMQTAGDWAQAARVLAKSAQHLQQAGADCIALATNTMHAVAPAIEAAITIPFIHIADPTATALLDDGMTRIGLLGTRFTMEMPFYKQRLVDRGLDVLTPQTNVTNLNGIIFEQLCRGIITHPSRQTYIRAIEALQIAGAEAIILGCTEISMLIDDSISPLPLYDTTQLHAEALVTFALT